MKLTKKINRYLCSNLGHVVLLFSIYLASTTYAAAQVKGWFRDAATSQSHIEASPVMVDLNQDGFEEVVIPRSLDDKLYVYNHDGTGFTQSWPQVLNFVYGTKSSPAIGDITGDGVPEIVVAGDNQLSEGGKIRAYDIYSGAVVASYNLDLTASASATPCLIDCYKYDGSAAHPGLEILFRDGLGKVNILVYLNGQFVNKYSSEFLTTTQSSQHDRYGTHPISPSVAAIALDSAKTLIAVGSTNNTIYRWEVQSTLQNNWSVTTKSALTTTGPSTTKFFSSIALAEFGSSPPAIIGATNSTAEVYIWDYNGNVLSGWPKQLSQAITSSPSISDLDGDGTKEILIGCDDGRVYVWNFDGTPVNGWPQSTEADILGTPVTGELDGQPGLEVVAGSLDGKLYVWSAQGELLQGWPKRLNTQIYGSPALADIHRSGRMSIAVGGYDGRLFLFDLTEKSLDTSAGWRQFRGGPLRQASW